MARSSAASRSTTKGGGFFDGIFLSPRLAYKFANGDTLTFQPFLASNRSRNGADSWLDQPVGSVAPEYAHQRADSHAQSSFLRGFGNWLHRGEAGARLEVKFGFTGGRSDSDTARNTYDAGGSALRRYIDSDASRDSGVNTGGKYSRPLGQGHLFAAGWDLEGSKPPPGARGGRRFRRFVRRRRRLAGGAIAPRGPVRAGRVGRHAAVLDLSRLALGGYSRHQRRWR
jgi:hypothetical protein